MTASKTLPAAARLAPGAAEAVERIAALDGPGSAIAGRVSSLVGPGALKDTLAGTWLGHALHPLLTDVVIGSFVSANVLDLAGGDDESVQRLLAVGIAAYGPTALTGVTDWADSEYGNPPVRRVGLVHAAANATALGLYTASLVSRRKGATGRGKLLALAGAGVLGAAGYLGAHLTYAQGIGPNQTAFDQGPADWTDAGAADELVPGTPRRAVADDTPVFLLRRGQALHALHDRCSHRGCSLADGEVQDGAVKCVCHGSRFSLEDGSVLQGPATTPQPVFDAREQDGRVQVKLRG
jgi:nitrite reductase/ring-hydroxylating ferredoxin subunit